jgi:NAD+ synthase (glutamine-hydrolysing)
MNFLRIALAQCNFTVGDFSGNQAIIREVLQKSHQLGVQLVAFPELALTGYPPEDLLLEPRFLQSAEKALLQVTKDVGDMVCVIGTVHRTANTYNAAAILHQGKLIDYYHKVLLPNYGVFDEKRYFTEGNEDKVLVVNGIPIGISICEDIWFLDGPVKRQAELGGAKLLLNISSSPYHHEKWKIREQMLSERAIENHAFVAYVNLIGGQDELVFDGGSVVIDPQGKVLARAKFFEEDFLVVDIENVGADLSASADLSRALSANIQRIELKTTEPEPLVGANLLRATNQILDPIEEVYQALILGTRDYLRKNGFKKAVIGLSGGIDSALVAAIAVEAIGKENVLGVTMPSPFSSKEGLEDAHSVANNLGIEILQVPITNLFQTYKDELKMVWRNFPVDADLSCATSPLQSRGEQKGGKEISPLLSVRMDAYGTGGNKRGVVEYTCADLPEGITEENLQARIRGNILMAISNKLGYIVLTTGNKSEMAVGYATLYGDMAGGFAVIKDVPKTLVFQIAKHINLKAGQEVIPQRVIDKPPSAELRPDQKDTDSLPPYEILDPILKAYVEDNQGLDEIVGLGFDHEMVRRVIRMVDLSEYKRRQSPPGIKITERAFGRDRRLPISNLFKM